MLDIEDSETKRKGKNVSVSKFKESVPIERKPTSKQIILKPREWLDVSESPCVLRTENQGF